MPEDILDRLKAREDEIEAYMNEVKKTASEMKERALIKAKELKNARIKEIDEEVKRIVSAGEDEIKKEALAIESEAAKEIEELRRRGNENMEKAVREVMRLITEGLDIPK